MLPRNQGLCTRAPLVIEMETCKTGTPSFLSDGGSPTPMTSMTWHVGNPNIYYIHDRTHSHHSCQRRHFSRTCPRARAGRRATHSAATTCRRACRRRSCARAMCCARKPAPRSQMWTSCSSTVHRTCPRLGHLLAIQIHSHGAALSHSRMHACI